ncbi:MAG TPA: C1 family peptidase [Anaeromyxobacter sp.]|nr:C1 family peptidase [Anaeromyxobacter sp.]
MCIGAWDHCIVIAGWEDFSCGTRWILKNSWGSGWGEGGYARARLDLGDIPWSGCGFSDVTLRGPTQMVPVGATPPPVVCEDRDGDRWCNWGTGPKPSTCAGLGCYTQGDPDDLACTAPTCAAVGSGKCGTFSNACGGVYCGCPSTRPVCVNGTCSGCPSGYKDCGDGRCIKSTLYCP